MGAIFIKLLNMSVVAGWLILAIAAIRPLLKKAPKALMCALWALVALRLILPFSLESTLSLIPSAQTVSPDIIDSQQPSIHSGIPAINSAINPVLSSSFAPDSAAGGNPLGIWTFAAAVIWLAGMAAMLVYAAISYLRLRRKVREAIPLRDNVRLCDHIKTPFILGVIRPHIYLPSDMDEADTSYVIAHENAHLKRRDHLWKPLGFLLLAVYWFNPLVWLAYIFLCRDMELACDERVIKGMGLAGKKAYSQALLSCSMPRRMIAACPLAFGEVGVKERIKTVLNYKKPTFWVIVVAVAACAVVGVCFLTNPTTTISDKSLKAEAAALARSCAMVNGVAIDENAVEIIRSGDGTAIEVIYPIPYTEGRIRVSFVMNGDIIYSACTELEQRPALSLNDVIMLSQKGEELMWADFDSYAYTETGSGLYIRVYEINAQYSLWIGGGSTEEKPMYIRLVSESNRDDYIDIRTQSVSDFISGHNIPVSAETFMYSFTVYMNPLSSYFPVGTTGYLYLAGEDRFSIVSEETGEVYALISPVDWKWTAMTEEEWNALFTFGYAPDISGVRKPLMMKLSAKYYLFNMDGGLWLGEYGGEKNGMWSVYELTAYEAKQTPAAADVTASPLDPAVSPPL